MTLIWLSSKICRFNMPSAGGSILVETITRYPGIGQLLYDSISSRDYTTIQGVLLLTTISVVIANLAADFLYSTIDPRVRVRGQEG